MKGIGRRMGSRGVYGVIAGLAAMLLVANARTAPAAACAGDCNGNAMVTVDEVITMVNVALEEVAVSACLAGDVNGDGMIAVNEIVTAVNRVLGGCAEPPQTPTPTTGECTVESCRPCTTADTACQPGQPGSYCCTLDGSFFGNPPAPPTPPLNDPLNGCRFSGNSPQGCWTAPDSTFPNGKCHTDSVCLSGGSAPTPAATPSASVTATASVTASGTTPSASATPTSTSMPSASATATASEVTPSASATATSTSTPNASATATVTATASASAMTPGTSPTATPISTPQTPGVPSRIITINNACGTELWVGAAGNNFSPLCTTTADCGGGDCVQGACTSVRCGSNSDCSSPNTFCGGLKANLPPAQVMCSVGGQQCPVNTTCNPDARVYTHDSTTCMQDSDCGAGSCDLGTHTCYTQCTQGTCPAPETCDTGKTGGACYANLCAYQTCYYVPVPVPAPAAGSMACGSNKDCTGGDFCFVANGSASDSGKTGMCTAIPTQGNYWDISAGAGPVEVNIPTPWAGRFWARTGCQTQSDGTFTCATGQCTDANNQPTKYCLGTPTGSPTLAEFSFPPYHKDTATGAEADDFYDVSMVDGANVQLQIAPAPSTYDLTTQNGTKASIPNNGGACATEDTLQTLCADPWGDQAPATCEQKWGWGWVCNGTACVNKFQCGSPGCLAGACGQYGYGAYVCPSTWDQTTAFALSASVCPADLHFVVNTSYVGCLAPGQACLQPSPPAGLNCGANQNLYLCIGDNSTSCYTSHNPSQSGSETACCGCPSWTPRSLCESGHDNTWTANVQTPYLDPFHATSPQAYSFPFDDKASTFTCVGQSATQNVSYALNFCPRN